MSRTHWRALLERSSLGAWDLVDAEGKPKDWVLVIERVEQKKVFTKRANAELGKPVIHFKGARKSLICGATLGETIESLYGSSIEDWVGKPITLYPTTTNVGPKRDVPCIRIRPTIPKRKADAALPDKAVDDAMRQKQNEAFNGDNDLDPDLGP